MAPDAVTIYNAGAVDSPNEYELPPGQAFIPTAITALFDGSGGFTDYRPALSFYTQDGHLVNRSFPEDDTISAGDSAEVSFRPF